jgi:hypothetical protein
MYTNDTGYSYTKANVKFCSKSCATTYQRGSLTKSQIEDEIIQFVTSKNRYCSKEEIQEGVQRSSKTFSKFNIGLKTIQESIGFTKSRSHFEKQIYAYLKKCFTDIECEKTFENLLSPKGFKLRVDFYIEKYNLIIEADGTQHTDKNNPWYNFYYYNCDLLKNKFAEKKGINIVRIPYTKKVTDAYIKKYLTEFI